MKIAVVGRGRVGGGLADLCENARHWLTRIGRDGGEVSDADGFLIAAPGARGRRSTSFYRMAAPDEF
jgi:predicted dinucleotide-binding enzyme